MKNSRDFIVSLVMFAALLNTIPPRIRQPYDKFNFPINSSCHDYNFMEEVRTWTISVGGGGREGLLFVCVFILRLIIFKVDSNMYISKGLPDHFSVFVVSNTAISLQQFRNANFSEQVIDTLHKLVQEKKLTDELVSEFSS